MRPFVKLADPGKYVACSWNLTVEAEGRAHWVEFFKRHVDTILKLGMEVAAARDEPLTSAKQRADACRIDFYKTFDAFAANPGNDGPVTILTLDKWRDDLLRKHGFVDAFIDLKNRENEKMLPLLPFICAEIDALQGEIQIMALIEGIFAGNIFDMGADATAKKFLGQSPDFFQTRASLSPRPWLIDDYDCLQSRLLANRPYRKAIFFIDNAGSDFLLGALPFARWLSQRDTQVILAGNERPTLNDMTVHDVRSWWPRILQTEQSFAQLPIRIVSTGTGEPLIDLAEVSDELNEISANADLVILEGMGRGVESNLDACFSCDALNIAMIKDTAVAKRVGGKVFDVVCRFKSLEM
ncbi:MAG TPA: ARMT1-like domain-containing protein [Tepidisphaeraceae bacterium]|jgi:type II pantothenate kinase|nr:ARMT1-like domain-containing protein [Tepidisphaeraceae bacterium]